MLFGDKTLFLVRFSVTTTQYLGENEHYAEFHRIVLATNEAEAESKIRALYRSEEYSHFYDVQFQDVSEAIL